MKRTELVDTQLKEMEQRFQEDVRSLQILADIVISREEVEVLAELIGDLLSQREFGKLRTHYPLCTSLFLVWCTVYHYKEGNLWEPIFAKLNIERGNRLINILGDLFLATLADYGLQLAP